MTEVPLGRIDWKRMFKEAVAERAALKAENERLRGYVKHRDACRKSDWDFDEECSCGLDTALREGEK